MKKPKPIRGNNVIIFLVLLALAISDRIYACDSTFFRIIDVSGIRSRITIVLEQEGVQITPVKVDSDIYLFKILNCKPTKGKIILKRKQIEFELEQYELNCPIVWVDSINFYRKYSRCIMYLHRCGILNNRVVDCKFTKRR